MSEQLLTPFAGNPRFPELRAYMQVDESDVQAFDRLPKDGKSTVEVFDEVSQQVYALRWADCGANCFCAAEIVERQLS